MNRVDPDARCTFTIGNFPKRRVGENWRTQLDQRCGVTRTVSFGGCTLVLGGTLDVTPTLVRRRPLCGAWSQVARLYVVLRI
jgi:hypothetical protein